MSEQAFTIPDSAPSVDSDAVLDGEHGRSTADASPLGSPHAGIDRPDSLHVEDQRFAVVPEWVIDAERTTLADRLHRSVDTVDRAMRQLVDAGMVRVGHPRAGRQNLSNRYHLRTTDPAFRGGAGGTGDRRSAADAAR